MTNLGNQVMVLAALSPREAALPRRHECTLSQVGSDPGMSLDVAAVQYSKKQDQQLGF